MTDVPFTAVSALDLSIPPTMRNALLLPRAYIRFG